MIICEVLKINTNEVWAFDYQVMEGSEMWQRLQESNNPTELGCWFVRNMTTEVVEENV